MREQLSDRANAWQQTGMRLRPTVIQNQTIIDQKVAINWNYVLYDIRYKIISQLEKGVSFEMKTLDTNFIRDPTKYGR